MDIYVAHTCTIIFTFLGPFRRGLKYLTGFLIWEFVALNGIVTMADNDLTPDLETPNIFAV